MAQIHQFVGQISDYTLGSTVEHRGYRLDEGRDLGNFHWRFSLGISKAEELQPIQPHSTQMSKAHWERKCIGGLLH
jgi:hypothetical protein